MPSLLNRMLFIFVFIFLLNFIRRFVFRATLKNKIEMPNKIQRTAFGVQAYLTIFMIMFTAMSFMWDDVEFRIASSILILAFILILIFTRRKFKRYYEETDESFMLLGQYLVYKVHYEDIVDWKPLGKQIAVLDGTREDGVYICVNFVFHKPEILLEKLAEMTFAGKFERADESQSDDPTREQEFIQFLQKHDFGYIVEDFIEA